ncbi:MAG: zf-HC2 domain-containing protein [Phycisphaerae bacterium]|jgi:hypothetical protein
MNCAEFEQLLDCYLDGEISGSLRLEFDAHRLRCRRCQLTVAMMESVQHVVTSDRDQPVLSDDFADRVMATIEQRRPLSLRLRPTRVAVATGALLQAAAVLLLAVLWPTAQTDTPNATGTTSGVAVVQGTESINDTLDRIFAATDDRTEQHEALYQHILGQVEAARATFASECNQLAQYPLALAVPDDFARISAGVEGTNPVGLLFEALVPGRAEESESSTPSAPNQYSL